VTMAAERAIDWVIDGRVKLCIFKEIIHEVLGILAQKYSKGPEERRRPARGQRAAFGSG
jgi:hypothetical protein